MERNNKGTNGLAHAVESEAYLYEQPFVPLLNWNWQNGDHDLDDSQVPSSLNDYEQQVSIDGFDYAYIPPIPMLTPANSNHEQHQQGIQPSTISPITTSGAPQSKRLHDDPPLSSMVPWAAHHHHQQNQHYYPPPSTPSPPSPRPFMFTNDDKYIITREGHVPVSVYLTQLHRIGAQFVRNHHGASFQLGVRGLPGEVFHFHPVFLTLQSLAFRQLYEGWDGRCGMFEVTVPYPETFHGVWEFLFTGDVNHFLRVWFSDSATLRRTWDVIQCLRMHHLPEEIVFRARLEFEAVRLRPPV